MSIAELEEAAPEPRHALLEPPVARRRHFQLALLILTWLCVAAMIGFYAWRVAMIGVDARDDFWVYWQNNRNLSDIANAMELSDSVLRDAEAIAQNDARTTAEHQTPAERNAQMERDRTNPPATIAHPGLGLLDAPWNWQIMRDRWHQLRPVYAQIWRGWIHTYDQLEAENPGGDFHLDYPPLRLMVMTFWTWRVESHFEGLNSFPYNPTQLNDPIAGRIRTADPNVVRPLLVLNRACDAISSVTMFFLVWLWVQRRPKYAKRPRLPRWFPWRGKDPAALPLAMAQQPWRGRLTGWREGWGDPILLLPAIALGIATLLRPHVGFEFSSAPLMPSLIDDRVMSVGWWIFVILRFLTAVSLAHLLPRPFRGPACGMVAATLVWLNPASILDSFGWPQWDVWLPPFFLLATLCISIDFWLIAGLLLGVGCMFKGQLLFVAPVLVLCPLLAGWLGKFMRIAAGLGAGAGLCVWPWLVTNSSSRAYISSAMFAAVIVCLISLYRKTLLADIRTLAGTIRRHFRNPADRAEQAIPASSNAETQTKKTTLLSPVENRVLTWCMVFIAMLIAAVLVFQLHRHQPQACKPYTVALTIGVLVLPWFLPRKSITGWLVFVFAFSLWLSAFSLSGSFSWWDVGFLNGTRRHQNMQLGENSLSNLSSILEKRYRWQLHDLAGTLHLPGAKDPIELEIQNGLALVYGLAMLLCTLGASIHLRRRDPRFLVALTAPWVLWVALLTQLAARYTILPAIIAASLVAVSVSLSLFELLFTLIACVMLGNQMMMRANEIAPRSATITPATHPDMGWMMLLIALIFLVAALTPSPRLARLFPQSPTPD